LDRRSTPQSPTRFPYFVGALLLSLASLALFFWRYAFATAADCHPELFMAPGTYLRFLFFLFANLFGVKGSGLLPYLVGGAVLAAMIGALLVSVVQLASETSPAAHQHWIAAILVAFSLLFSINAAYGRSCLGPYAAQMSRHIIWTAPGVLGLYFFLCALPTGT